MSDISLADQIGQMLRESQSHTKAKRSASRKAAGKRSKANPYKEITTKEVNGKFEVTEVDHRLADPYWSDVARIVLVREVECKQCGLIQSAPNEFMMKRMEHPVHGRIDEAITLGDSKHDNLPIKIEVHRNTIHLCQHCITEVQAAGGDTVHSSQTAFDFDVGDIAPAEETPVDLNDLFESPENQAALEGM